MERATDTENELKKAPLKNKGFVKRAIVPAVVVLVLGMLVVPRILGNSKPEPEVIAHSTLQKITNVSELSTFTATYNGVAQVMNEEDPEETDYYVSYEAKVNAGIDFEAVDFVNDEETKELRIVIPEVYITDVLVDISSLDFIFQNSSANVSAVTQEALKACEEDVWKESAQQAKILELAQQNAESVLSALTLPIVEQLYPEYTLVVE